MVLIDFSFVFKLFDYDLFKPFYSVCSILFILLFVTLTFIDLLLFTYESDFYMLRPSEIVNDNYANIVFFSLLGAFALLALIFSTMYSGKIKDNKHWFICTFVFVCLHMITLIVFNIYSFASMFSRYIFLYILMIVIFGILGLFLSFSVKSLFMLCGLSIMCLVFMFFYNFMNLFNGNQLIEEVNSFYYEDSFIPNVINDLSNDLMISMAQLQFNMMNFENQMNYINNNYICNTSVTNANMNYLSSMSSLIQLNQQINNFNQMLSDNIGNVDNINVLNQRMLAVFNVAKNILRNYFINNFQYSNYFPDDLSFISWIYEMISLIKSSSYMNLRNNYVKYYILDGNFAVFDDINNICNTSYLNLSVNMSFSDLMNLIGMPSASVVGNIVSYNNNNVGMISNLYSSDIFQNIFTFTNLNWNNNVFAVTIVYNWIPYTFLFAGSVNGASNLVGVMSNNYLLHLFDSNSSNIYRIDFINKKYTLFKCFTAFNSYMYNSNDVSFSIKNNGSFEFFQCINNGSFESLS